MSCIFVGHSRKTAVTVTCMWTMVGLFPDTKVTVGIPHRTKKEFITNVTQDSTWGYRSMEQRWVSCTSRDIWKILI
jgi:hypothetical protein